MTTKKKNNNYNKDQSALEHEYQSTFLPIFSHAEIQIKKMIAKYFWNLQSKSVLIMAINRYIAEVNRKIPKDLKDRDAYLNGLRKKSMQMVEVYYTKARITFASILAAFVANIDKPVKITTPKELITYMSTNKIKYNMWPQAKAAIRVQNYPKQLKEYIKNLSGETITTSEPGKKGISLWQKAELDIRYEHQMSMIQKLKDEGEDLCWISSHPDCSKRCEKWQGKLVSLSKHATMSGFRIEKIDGHWVYSLTDIMNQVDKHGYKNNIINGFNCRHYLKPYTPGSSAPKQYDGVDIKKMRQINSNLRSMEREIRQLKQQEKISIESSDIKNARIVHNQISKLTQKYYNYCEKNGFAAWDYRIKI